MKRRWVYCVATKSVLKMLSQPLSILLVLVAVIAASLWLCDRYRWAAAVSSVVWILALAAVASNLGLIPTDAPLYGQMASVTVPFAVALILLRVRLSDLRQAGRSMLGAFALAAAATVIGVLLAGFLLDGFLESAVGGERWKLAGPYTGTYIGGSLNFFALWDGLEIGQPDLFAAANAVDNLTIFPLFLLWTMLPTALGRFYRNRDWSETRERRAERAAEESDPRLRPTHIMMLAFLGLFIMVASEWLNTTFIAPSFPQVPTILIITTLALAVGQLPWVAQLEGASELGYLAFYLFFAAVGALIDVYKAVVLSPILFAYVSIIIVVHMVVVYGIGRLLRMDIAVLTVASAAAKAGPPMIPALTEARGWERLNLPGVLVGLLGYAIGNYVGFAAAYAMRALVS
jgi:uncharacterized membrane protein